MPNERAIPLIITCDVEPDARQITGHETDWPGFVRQVDFVRSVRPKLEDLTGAPVRFTWMLRLDHQIAEGFGSPAWVLEKHADKFEALLASGDELGLHVHTWRRARRFFRQVWMADYENDDWCRSCIELAHDTYFKHFGERPTSISMGDNFMSAAAMTTIERLGLTSDSSLSPGIPPRKAVVRGEKTRGTLPDARRTPTHPFRPSRADFTVPGEPSYAVWEIPVSSGVVKKNRDGTDRIRKLLLGGNPDHVRTIVNANLDAGVTALVADSRTDALMGPKTGPRFRDFFDNLPSYTNGRAVRFSTRREVCDRLDSSQPAGGP